MEGAIAHSSLAYTLHSPALGFACFRSSFFLFRFVSYSFFRLYVRTYTQEVNSTASMSVTGGSLGEERVMSSVSAHDGI